MSTRADLIDDLAEAPEEILDGLPKWGGFLVNYVERQPTGKSSKRGDLKVAPLATTIKSHRPHHRLMAIGGCFVEFWRSLCPPGFRWFKT